MATVLYGRHTIVVGLLLVVIAIVTLWLWPQPPSTRDVPVIIYLVDTLRADRLGIYGYSKRAKLVDGFLIHFHGPFNCPVCNGIAAEAAPTVKIDPSAKTASRGRA